MCRLGLISLLLFLFCEITCTPYSKGQVVKLNINQGWTFKQVRSQNSYPATVPGSIHTDLMKCGIIEDPYFRLNERGVQWVDKEDWEYSVDFQLPQEFLNKDYILLNCMGLDTYADVYLNDSLLFKADNMFREWKYPIKSCLKQENNTLRVYFHSPIKQDLPKWNALNYQYEAGNDQSENGGVFDRKLSVFARKAPYHYGWDWGPRLVTSGIWRPIFIEAWNGERITDVYYEQKEVTKNRALVIAHVTLQTNALVNGVIEISNKDTGKIYTAKKVSQTSNGSVTVALPFEIYKPQLWWTKEWGTPHLYKFLARWASPKGTDSLETKVGLRSLKLIRNEDTWGKSFYFELNGYPLFARGANVIPGDNFLHRMTADRYKKMVDDAADAHMNMLRVWGGGIYEDDAFYQYCDEKGILVWQDFSFACSLYPGDSLFLNSVFHEAVDNIKRLRNHPSLALWCGNNEMTLAWHGWGWKRRYFKKSPEIASKIWSDYETLFHKLLPNLVDSLDAQRPYTPSSPYSRPDGVAEPNRGDYHYWGVWHEKKPISEYNRVTARFFSEYGFQSFPEWHSILRYAPKSEDQYLTSEVMLSHQRGGSHANQLIKTYLEKEYGNPKDFSSFVYLTQLLQADAMKTAIEAHRRNKPYCMGSLFWQLNDCWPVASWSSIDYYGKWKATQYFAKKAFNPIIVSPTLKNDSLAVFVVSDLLKTTVANLAIDLYHVDKGLVSHKDIKVNIPANTSSLVWEGVLSEIPSQVPLQKLAIVVRLVTSLGNTITNIIYGDIPKNMSFPTPDIRYTIHKSTEGGYLIRLESNKWAKAVCISSHSVDINPSDNYFDMLPNTIYDVYVKTSATKEELQKALRITSFTDCF